MIAPFTPFLAETLWQNLAGVFNTAAPRVVESVHLCDYPTGDASAVDEQLSARMKLLREIASLGLSARMANKLKVRQPLAKVEVVLVHPQHQSWLEAHAGLIREELNVKQVEFIPRADQYISYTVLPDLKKLGPRLGKRLPALKQALAAADAAALLAKLESDGQVALELADGPVTLDTSDIQIRLQAKPGWAAAQGSLAVVVLSTELTDELLTEGHARELTHAIQTRRKDLSCEYTDRIAVGVVAESAELRGAVEQFGDYLKAETLAVELKLGPIAGVEPVELDLAGHKLSLFVQVVSAR
jgi:isoleucyl-tRNA synthetase